MVWSGLPLSSCACLCLRVLNVSMCVDCGLMCDAVSLVLLYFLCVCVAVV